MGAVQAGFYYLFSLVSVESGPRGPSLSVYILHIPVDDTALGTPRIRSDFRSGSDALLKPSTHSPDRLLTCASSEDFSYSRSSFSLAALESSARGHSSFRFSTSRSSSKVAYAFRLLVPIVSLSPRSLPILSSSFYSPAFSPLAALEPSVSRPDYHLAPFSDRRPTPLRFVAQAHCQHITVAKFMSPRMMRYVLRLFAFTMTSRPLDTQGRQRQWSWSHETTGGRG